MEEGGGRVGSVKWNKGHTADSVRRYHHCTRPSQSTTHHKSDFTARDYLSQTGSLRAEDEVRNKPSELAVETPPPVNCSGLIGAGGEGKKCQT